MVVLNFGRICVQSVYIPCLFRKQQKLLFYGKGVCFLIQYSSDDLSYRYRRRLRYYLAFTWSMGLVVGLWLYSSDNYISSLMRSVFSSSVSIVPMLSVILLPFLLSAFAVYQSRYFLIFLICFLKAFLFSYVSVAVYQAYGSAGWLVRLLVLFGDCIGVPLLYWYWLRMLSARHRLIWLETFALTGIAVMIGSIDYSIISPLVGSLDY